ncbi:hypothetical protein Q9L58_010972 [Maublancomyces gigas]|uniref:Uncharacterized protein n=1 Tax=Discina gigas TaxID=1032678 RepID=A0ABR3G2K3_9PEZI
MQLYFRTKRIKNKTSGVNLRKWDPAVDHCLSQPAIRRHRRLLEEESDEGQYLRGMINTMLIDFAKPKKRALADGSDGLGDEGEGEGKGEGEGEEIMAASPYKRLSNRTRDPDQGRRNTGALPQPEPVNAQNKTTL